MKTVHPGTEARSDRTCVAGTRIAGMPIGRCLVTVLMIGMLAAACGQAYDRDDAVLSFSIANPTATAGQSECVVDNLIERYGIEGLESELAADPPEQTFAEAQFRDMFACGMEGDVRDQIADQLLANEVAEADAPCVADALFENLNDDDIDVLLSGEITDAFFARFVSAMEQCGAINGGGSNQGGN